MSYVAVRISCTDVFVVNAEADLREKASLATNQEGPFLPPFLPLCSSSLPSLPPFPPILSP